MGGMTRARPGANATEGSRSSRSAATAATAATLVAGRRKRLQEKGGGRRRGGERRPRARSGPGGGGRLRPYGEHICKVPPYATTRVGFPTTGGVSATGTRCSVSSIELQHMPMGLRRVYR